MFLETGLVFTLLAYMNPADPSYSHIYPSGVKDGDDFIYHAPPAYIAPEIFVPQSFVYKGTLVKTGPYLVKPTTDEQKLLFLSGDDTVIEFDVSENTIVSSYRGRPHVEILYLDDKIIITYQIENIFKTVVILKQASL